ncbi:hypothetical protein LT493_17760 [Streptomyces tricolor]|nr:hypothetical protein [Streptomyces tricolor]
MSAVRSTSRPTSGRTAPIAPRTAAVPVTRTATSRAESTSSRPPASSRLSTSRPSWSPPSTASAPGPA